MSFAVQLDRKTVVDNICVVRCVIGIYAYADNVAFLFTIAGAFGQHIVICVGAGLCSGIRYRAVRIQCCIGIPVGRGRFAAGSAGDYGSGGGEGISAIIGKLDKLLLCYSNRLSDPFVNMEAFIIKFSLLNLPIREAVQCLVTCFRLGCRVNVVCESVASGVPFGICHRVAETVNAYLFSDLQSGGKKLFELICVQGSLGDKLLYRAVPVIYRCSQAFGSCFRVELEAVLGEGYAELRVIKGKVEDRLFAVVGKRVFVYNGFIRVDVTVISGADAVLISDFFRQHAGVNDLDVGLDTEVCGSAVALHVVEVEVVDLAVLKTADIGDIVKAYTCF